eukprot:6023456-Pleurochrysis_carterae.AAC.1
MRLRRTTDFKRYSKRRSSCAWPWLHGNQQDAPSCRCAQTHDNCKQANDSIVARASVMKTARWSSFETQLAERCRCGGCGSESEEVCHEGEPAGAAGEKARNRKRRRHRVARYCDGSVRGKILERQIESRHDDREEGKEEGARGGVGEGAKKEMADSAGGRIRLEDVASDSARRKATQGAMHGDEAGQARQMQMSTAPRRTRSPCLVVLASHRQSRPPSETRRLHTIDERRRPDPQRSALFTNHSRRPARPPRVWWHAQTAAEQLFFYFATSSPCTSQVSPVHVETRTAPCALIELSASLAYLASILT